MKNFPVNVDGHVWWISRSVAVSINVFTKIDGKVCVLANKRGPGLPNKVGKWSSVSGYVDFDENLEQACRREVFEETNIVLNNTSNITFYKYEDDPTREGQVILFRFFTFYNGLTDTISNKNAEPDEVDDIKWIPLDELDNYDWTSIESRNLIKEIYYKNYYNLKSLGAFYGD